MLCKLILIIFLFQISPEYKQTPDPHPHCQVCLKTTQTQNTPHPPKTPRLAAADTCPACGIPLNAQFTDYSKRIRTSTSCDKDIITSEMVPVDAADIADEKLPWEPVKYDEYSDAIGRLLLKKWKFDERTEHITLHEVRFLCNFLNDIDTRVSNSPRFGRFSHWNCGIRIYIRACPLGCFVAKFGTAIIGFL